MSDFFEKSDIFPHFPRSHMQLIDLVNRTLAPAPWSEGDNIPWNDPAFSERMLQEHLSQAHNAASRRLEKIDRHVAWIQREAPGVGGQPTHILDLGCGPGLYASRFARLGHTCVGIDFSPASIRYAVQHAPAGCTYVEGDIRQVEYGAGYGLAMLIFGELNVFKPADARDILAKMHVALNPGGGLLLEISTDEAVQQMGQQPRTWYTAPQGLFADRPYVMLEENSWDASTRTATTRHVVVDAVSAEVTRYAASYQAYRRDEITPLLTACGFGDVRFYPSLLGVPDPEQTDKADMIVVVARRQVA
jgi:SAM-dependent methyltransferase